MSSPYSCFIFMVLLAVTGTGVSSLPTGHPYQTQPSVSTDLWKMWVQRGETILSRPTVSSPPESLACPPCQEECTISVKCRCVVDLECLASRKQSSFSSGKLSSGRIRREVILRSFIRPPLRLCKDKNQIMVPPFGCKPNRMLSVSSMKPQRDHLSILPPS